MCCITTTMRRPFHNPLWVFNVNNGRIILPIKIKQLDNIFLIISFLGQDVALAKPSKNDIDFDPNCFRRNANSHIL